MNNRALSIAEFLSRLGSAYCVRLKQSGRIAQLVEQCPFIRFDGLHATRTETHPDVILFVYRLHSAPSHRLLSKYHLAAGDLPVFPSWHSVLVV